MLVEREDVESFVVGTDVTFINWGNLTITKIEKDENGKVSLLVFSTLHLKTCLFACKKSASLESHHCNMQLCTHFFIVIQSF